MKKTVILALTFMPIILFGQSLLPGGNGNINSLPLNIASPNAASLGIYGQIPVNYFNGLPNISIPLFSLENVNIGLSYHATGIRPEEHPGWVGLAWDGT